MATDVPGLQIRRSGLSYAIVLLGAALFVTSCFLLPYQGFDFQTGPVAPTTTIETTTLSL